MKLQVENLEAREMPASFVLDNGTLICTGNLNTYNHIRVYESGDDVVVQFNSQALRLYDADTVDNIVLRGGLKDDVLTNDTRKDAVITGRTGSDILSGGLGDDIITGGAGRDTVYDITGHNTINVGGYGSYRDTVYTNMVSTVNRDAGDVVLRTPDAPVVPPDNGGNDDEDKCKKHSHKHCHHGHHYGWSNRHKHHWKKC